MIATTIEQSQKLIKLGIDVNTADMMWDDWNLIDEGWKLSVGYYSEIEKDYGRKCYPAWSLSALLEVMPRPDLYRETADLWVCVTFFKEGSIRGFGETAIDAACDVITKIFVRGYLKKKGGQDDNNHQ